MKNWAPPNLHNHLYNQAPQGIPLQIIIEILLCKNAFKKNLSKRKMN